MMAIVKAIEKIVARHDALRSTFSEDGETQHIAETLHLDIPISDFSQLGRDECNKRFAEAVASTNREPFKLSEDPLVRAHIFKLKEKHHVLLFTTHHIVVDGWSRGVLLSELGAIYSAECEGKTLGLPEPVQFIDYVRREKNPQENGEAAASETYWLAQFKDSVPILDLPTDWPRPALKTYASARQRIVLPPCLGRGLRRVAAQKGATLFATILAGYQALLHRLTGQHDIVVGVPTAGQLALDAQDLVGHCVNFLPLRTHIEEGASFLDYLAAVRSRLLDGYDHQNCTYGSLIQKLDLRRDPSRLPLVPVSFNLDKHRSDPDFADLDVEVSNRVKSSINFDCEINVLQEGNELQVTWDYNSDLFDADTIRRWLSHYYRLLESVVTDPEQRISDLALLTDVEEHQLLVEWNDSQREYPKDKCIHELFEAQAERCPDAVAVVFEEQRLTYRELNSKANQLASYLRGLGVAPQTLVGLCVERSLEMVIGLLGILKAGGTYVPLDPAYPEERLAFMLQDAQVQIILTQQPLISAFPADHGVQLLCLDTDCAQLSEHTDTNLDNAITSENLAYVIYTSGSTGKPKGVQISHRAVVNFLSSMQREPGLAANDIMLAVTTLSFDIAALELYLPLTVGARVVIVSREVAADGTQLIRTLEDCGATIMQATPATWRMLLETGWQGSDHLKILCGGEALSSELAGQLLTRSLSLWNMYGPTESTIWSSIYRVEMPDGQIPIGRPIANTQLYILDRNQQVLPIGVPGELYIGGDGLAQGYLNRPELTEEKFIVNPFSSDRRKRLYKTGDLARRLSDGNIEILGRLDHQVKIRGFRIELGEIEAVLAQHPGVREIVVTANGDEPANKRLVAYIVSRDVQSPTANELRALLNAKVPTYMVPSAFVFLDTLPLTPNGKVDCRALPAPDQSRQERGTQFVAPRTPVEEILTNIWVEVLKLPKIGVYNNFFELGGHSLLATQVVSRVREAFRINLPVRVLFESSTIEELALVIEETLIDEMESLPEKESQQI
jgi:amino acid adenylation domain-containing protein